MNGARARNAKGASNTLFSMFRVVSVIAVMSLLVDQTLVPLAQALTPEQGEWLARTYRVWRLRMLWHHAHAVCSACVRVHVSACTSHATSDDALRSSPKFQTSETHDAAAAAVPSALLLQRKICCWSSRTVGPLRAKVLVHGAPIPTCARSGLAWDALPKAKLTHCEYPVTATSIQCVCSGFHERKKEKERKGRNLSWKGLTERTSSVIAGFGSRCDHVDPA